MDVANQTNPSDISKAALTPLVQRALGRAKAEVTSWRSEPVHGGAGGGGIYRFSGSARDGNEALPWSLIHKVIRAKEDTMDPTTLRYWAREPLAYKSGALAGLPGGLVTPRCYGITEIPNQEYRFWLEDVTESSEQWSLAHYGLVARQLGRFNAAYLLDTPLPSWPWLSRSCLRSWLTMRRTSPNTATIRSYPDHPRVRRWYPGSMLEQVLRLWDEREVFLSALERLPQTLCHLDVFRRNLLMRRLPGGQEQAVFIDWAFMGTGALGEELAPLLAASVGFFGIDAGKLEELDQVVFDSYLAGLADAGWRGDPQTVRFAYAAASAVRFALPIVTDPMDEAADPMIEQVLGRPMAEVAATWVELRRYLFDLADEARGLLDVVR